MQKQSMFQSFMKKKQLISKMITQSKAPRNRQQFHHFEAISEPVYIKAQSNAIYLTHLNTEFKDQLRQFVHQQESFKETMFQLAKITEAAQNEQQTLQKEYKNIRNQLNQVQLEKQCLSDKNNAHLQKIMTLQEQERSLLMRGEEYEKIATTLEQDTEYENCVSDEIKAKNTQIVEKLEIKSAEIQTSTFKLQTLEREMRQKESRLKSLKEDIKSVYFTLQAQDDALSSQCTLIQQSLNKQNNHINDIEFLKNNLTHVLTEGQKRRKQLKQANQTQQKLMNCYQDLQFDIRRTKKELELEQKGIDQEYWGIEREQQKLLENYQMLAELRQFLADLLQKNEMMEQCLEEQIIEDYAVKKVVESKCLQPVGKKTRMFLQEIEDKQLASTKTSWYKENIQSPDIKKHQHSSSPMSKFTPMSPSVKRNIAQKQIDRICVRVPQQMEFVFDKYNNSINQFQEQQEQQYEEKEDPCMMNTGFSYIDRLAKFYSEA